VIVRHLVMPRLLDDTGEIVSYPADHKGFRRRCDRLFYNPLQSVDLENSPASQIKGCLKASHLQLGPELLFWLHMPNHSFPVRRFSPKNWAWAFSPGFFWASSGERRSSEQPSRGSLPTNRHSRRGVVGGKSPAAWLAEPRVASPSGPCATGGELAPCVCDARSRVQ
jgi:hypothetical protein